MDLEGRPLDAEAFRKLLQKHVPQIFELASIEMQILCSKDSSDIEPSDWVLLAQALRDRLDEFDAFVVTHGTDTMAYSASALSFILRFPGKPIVFTGSQRPLADLRSDAPRNLLNAVQIGLEDVVREVTIFFDSHLLRGNRAKKMSIPSFRAFESPNFAPLAHIGTHTEYRVQESPSKMATVGPAIFDARLDSNVAAISLFPGFASSIFDGIQTKKMKGLVLQAFGPGDIPVLKGSIVEWIKQLDRLDVPVVICSQAVFGSVDLSLYETGRAARDAGAISAGDMTFEAVVTKMMCLLGRGHRGQAFREKFSESLAGELSLKSDMAAG